MATTVGGCKIFLSEKLGVAQTHFKTNMEKTWNLELQFEMSIIGSMYYKTITHKILVDLPPDMHSRNARIS